MTDGEILTAIRARGFPSAPDLEDAEVTEAIAGALRDLRAEYPLMTYGTFNLVSGQQVYDLFNAVVDVTTSQGAFPGGLRVLEVIWNVDGTGGDLSVFGIAPFLQGALLPPGELSATSFSTPGDWLMFDLNWASFTRRFGQQAWEQVENRPGAPLRLFPQPETTRTAFCRFTKARTVADLQGEDESWFLQFVEAQCCFVLARKLRCVAGVNVGTVKMDGKSALYWQADGERKLMEAWCSFRRRAYVSGSPVQRSY